MEKMYLYIHWGIIYLFVYLFKISGLRSQILALDRNLAGGGRMWE